MPESTDTNVVEDLLGEIIITLNGIKEDTGTLRSDFRAVIGTPEKAAQAGITLFDLNFFSGLSQSAGFDPIQAARSNITTEPVMGYDMDANLLIFAQDFFISDPPGQVIGSSQSGIVMTALEKKIKALGFSAPETYSEILEALSDDYTDMTAFRQAAAITHPKTRLITWNAYENTLYNGSLMKEYLTRADQDGNYLKFVWDFKFPESECPIGLTEINKKSVAFKTFTISEYIASRGV